MRILHRSLVACSVLFLISQGLAFAAHPPANGAKQKPLPAQVQADLKEARRLLDTAKQKATAQGQYSCCVKAPEGSKVAGCDICLRNNGSCNCAANLKAGKGVCGQCHAGWQAGQGNLPGIKKEDVKLLASPEQKKGEALASMSPELQKARELLNNAKRAMHDNGNWACCITEGGCDECAFEGNCPCGIELNEGKEGQGVCGSCLDGWHAGKGAFEGIPVAEVKLNQEMGQHGGGAGMQGMHGSGSGGMNMAGHSMKGMTGDWAMNREGSGTSWLPETSPMYMKMGMLGRFNTMFHGYAYGVYTDQGGKRGEDKLYASSQVMAAAWQRFGRGDANIFGARLMLSADPATMGTRGYPLLFQTGESAGGQPLIDRQHPHDLVMELAVNYARRLTPKGGWANLYFAPVGEPALGPTAFPHRPSAFDNPEAPLTHHWFDSTHITYGVATAGVASNTVKVEGSVFTGREPDEHRYTWDKPRFDSYSGRVSVNPTKNLSAQISHGFLKSPEDLEAQTNQQRTTATVSYNLPLHGGKDNWQTMTGVARNNLYHPGEAKRTSDAFLLETSYLAEKYTLFGRYERVGKDELFPGDENHTNYTINKLGVGGVLNVAEKRDSQIGVGGSVSLYAFPSALQSSYGSSPISFNLFLRVRTGKM